MLKFVKFFLHSLKISNFEEQLWLWEYQTENRVHDLFMDLNKEVRLRVVDHIFADSAPVSDAAKEDNENESCNSNKSPYTIIVSKGLGDQILRSEYSQIEMMSILTII